MKFPDIRDHLQENSSFELDVRVNGGRNLAQVMLNVYNLIPLTHTELRDDYISRVGGYLEDSAPFIAPEIFPGVCWPRCGNLLSELFQDYYSESFVEDCRKEFTNSN